MSKKAERWTDWNDPNQRIPTRATPLPAEAPVWVAELPAVSTVDEPDARYAPGPVTIRCFKPGVEPPQIKPPKVMGDWLSALEASESMGVSKAHFSIMAKRLNFARKYVNGNTRLGEPRVLFSRQDIAEKTKNQQRR